MYCRYHGRHEAVWHCDHCHLDLCSVCIPGGENNFRAGHPHCPACLKTLRWMGDTTEKEPFWRVAPQLFRYPMTWPLLMMALVAGLISELFFLFDLMIMVIVVRYGLMVIATLAKGDMAPPPLSDALGGDVSPFFRQIGALLVMFTVPVLAYFISPGLSMAMQVLVMLAIPANIMLLAVTGSMAASLNPVAWVRMMWAIGAPYILLWFALMAVQSAPYLLATAGPAFEGMFRVLVGIVSFYTSLVCFAMMGYLLYEHASKFDLVQNVPRGKDLPQEDYERRTALGISHIYAQEGKAKDALKVINKALERWPVNLPLNERKYRLLRLTPEVKSLPSFAEEYMRMLAVANNPGSASDVYLDMRAICNDFLPQGGDVRLALARHLADRGKWQDASRLLVNLHSSHPKFEGLPESYVLLARIYLEGLGNQGNAAKLIRFLRQRWPSSLESEEGALLLNLYGRTELA
jgi:tetratricopeptide (TPR) repeat protein